MARLTFRNRQWHIPITCYGILWTAVLLAGTASATEPMTPAAISIKRGFDSDDASDRAGAMACQQTSHAARRACTHGVKDRFWLAVGKCRNINRTSAKTRCMQAAKAERHAARKLCRAQFQARQDICRQVGPAPYDPFIDPAEFLDPAGIAANPNPYFPLLPGLKRVYRAGQQTITVSVTDKTKEVLGVTCIVVRDVVEENGQLIEDTVDWYAQDIHGNVWYFGEIARNFEDGELVNLDGSWKAGRDGAKPGIIMQAAPQVGAVYRQEFLLAEAEDMAEVLSVHDTSAATPAADCAAGCVVTRDFLPIEPGVQEHKYYAPGIGNILVIDVATGERDELIELTLP